MLRFSSVRELLAKEKQQQRHRLALLLYVR
jgi:hypothetical protein